MAPGCGRSLAAAVGVVDRVHGGAAGLRSHAQVPLAAGEYEINVYPLSEIISNKKLKNLGAVIPPLQVPAIIEATVGKNAADPKTALSLIKFLQGPAIDGALKDYGMEKGQIGK